VRYRGKLPAKTKLVACIKIDIVKLAGTGEPHITKKILITQPLDCPSDALLDYQTKWSCRLLTNSKVIEKATATEKV
jgi:hypothetical protein